MKKKRIEDLLDLAEINDGYVSVEEAKKKGIEQTYLCTAEEAGIFVKASKGLYIKKGYPIDPYYILHFRYHKAVFCLSSALYLHGMAPAPSQCEIALPRGYMTSGIAGARVHRFNNKEYLLGLSLAVSPHGPLVPVYDKERTIVDVILHNDLFSDEEYCSLLNHLKEFRLNEEKLQEYAKEMKAEKLIHAVMKGRI